MVLTSSPVALGLTLRVLRHRSAVDSSFFNSRFRMNRRKFVRQGLIGGVALASVRALADDSRRTTNTVPLPQSFELDEASVADLQKGMAAGKYTAQMLTQKYLDRINEIDKHGPAIN